MKIPPNLKTMSQGAAGLLLVLLLWDHSGLDLTLARWFGTAQGFAWRDNWWLTKVMHDWAHNLSWLVLLALLLGVRWPWGWMRWLSPVGRWQFALGPLVVALLISMLKGANATSCPWDVAEFGGPATHLSHWLGFVRGDGGGGHCFPAGHASSGFSFVAGYFVLRRQVPEVAGRWLAGALLAGLMLGVVQQVRGAHFMSHTLWTGWLCWCMGWGFDQLWHRVAQRRQPARAGA